MLFDLHDKPTEVQAFIGRYFDYAAKTGLYNSFIEGPYVEMLKQYLKARYLRVSGFFISDASLLRDSLFS